MQLRRFAAFVLAAIAPAFAADEYTCPVTKPPDPPFAPPPPYELKVGPRPAFWFGNKNLWTLLPANGVWNGLPEDSHFMNSSLILWSYGYDPKKQGYPHMEVDFTRLDKDAPPIHTYDGNQVFFDKSWAMLNWVTFPKEGCWKIRVGARGQTLTFVVSMQP